MGGADGGIWPDAAPPSFVTNMANGVVGVVTSLGLDGIDFDIERRAWHLSWKSSLRSSPGNHGPRAYPYVLRSRSGDLVKCGQLLSAVISALVSAKPGIYISFAPQMTDM